MRGESLNILNTDVVLAGLADQLAARRERFELVVVGGTALLALRLVDRTTRDVNLPRDWLNAGPSSLLDLGVPEGFEARLERRDYGTFLTIWFASRLDQIHFKLYALTDQGPGKHEQDLRALDPTPSELLQAARWTITHDPSEGFRRELLDALAFFGVEDADLGA